MLSVPGDHPGTRKPPSGPCTRHSVRPESDDPDVFIFTGKPVTAPAESIRTLKLGNISRAA